MHSWGLNNFDQLGYSTSGDQTLPRNVVPAATGPCDAANMRSISQLAAGTWTTLVLLRDGVVCGFGRDHFGQLGQRTVGSPVVTPTGAMGFGQAGQSPNQQTRAQLTHSSSDQCSMTVTNRTGNWTCAISLSASGVVPATAGHCKPHQAWCWHLVPGGGRSTWTGRFAYGHGRRTLGKVTLYYEVALHGRRSVSKPVRFESFGAVRHLTIEGDRLFYDSNWPAGHAISPRVHESYLHHPATVAANTLVVWPGGYEAFEKAPVHVGAVIHTWTWHVSGYRGDWFVFAKSIHYYFRGKSAFFYKRWQKRLGKDPVGEVGGRGSRRSDGRSRFDQRFGRGCVALGQD